MMKRILMASAVMMVATSLPAETPVLTVAVPTMGTWAVTGNVQGVPVTLSCALATAADLTVSGSCVDDQTKSHPVKGTVKEQTLTWSFDSEYEGSPITVTLTGVVDETGAKMAGTIYVDPMNADGDFSATLKPQATT
ncbi:hypothetical protein GOB94_01285 [Granulicella sp. 5B5]|uniref:hypothetical protein n=1 Tax=Granulicella sp. 5B5 TaxID=1617967 RepID=UPI0015F77E85|nr:hypothetical protein [Granulicella sp. 5B5]QMV17493.1 hypothetical protein GOB94_01285 [Granulicella sp. 5B5]